jgi:hypothetical protein
MFDRFTILFSLSVIGDRIVFVLALMLIVRRQFGSIGYWLLVYAISALYGDYHFGMETRQKALYGAVNYNMLLPPTASFVVDLLGRIVLLIAIWMFFVKFVRTQPAAKK